MISNEGRYLCQWAPATGFLLVTFGTVGALTSFEFSESGQPPLNTRWAENPKLETQELPPWYRLILFESFLGILLLDPAFSSNILLNKFVQVFDTLKIPVHCFGTWDTKVICLSVSQALFLLLCHFHMNLNIHNLWLNWLPTYCWQFSTSNHPATFMWSDWQIPGWPQFFQQQFFHSVPCLVNFNCAIIFRSFHFDFVCAILAEPIISYSSFSNLQSAHRMIHPGNCSPAQRCPPPLVSIV